MSSTIEVVVQARKRLTTASKLVKRVKIPLKPKKPLKKAKPLSKLKKELDSVFSQWVRKDATSCYTCGLKGTAKTLQAGHFVPRQYLATRWEPDNVKSQCVGCNIWGKGKVLDFEEHLIREIGAECVQALKDKRKELWKLDRNWYEEKIAYYKSQVVGFTDGVSVP